MKNKLKLQIRMKRLASCYKEKTHIKAFIQKINKVSYLWSLEPKAVIRATWLGISMIFIPIGFRGLIIAILSKILHANYFVAFSISWLRNPLTIVPILYFEYYIGSQIINSTLPFSLSGLSVNLILINWKSILIPLVIGSIIVTTVATIAIGTSIWTIHYLINKLPK